MSGFGIRRVSSSRSLSQTFSSFWHGTELVLLPTCSAEYKECTSFTKAQSGHVTKGDMSEGHTYVLKDMTNVMYLGHHDFCERPYYSEEYKPLGLRHVFLHLAPPKHTEILYVTFKSLDKISAKTSEEVSPYFADAFTTFKKSRHSDRVVSIKLEKAPITKDWVSWYLLKEGDQYRIAVKKYYGKGMETYTLGSVVDLTVRKGMITLPKRVRRGEGEERFKAGDDFYVPYAVSEQGHHFNLPKLFY